MQTITVGSASYLILWTVVLLEGVLILALGRLVGQLNRRIPPSGARLINPGPEIGAVIDNFDGEDLLEQHVSFRFPRERGLFLLYLSPHCSSCSGLVPVSKRFFREIASEADAAYVMVLGSRATQVAYAREHGLAAMPVFSEDQLPGSWQVQGAPFAVWISSSGEAKAKGMVNNREHLESLHNAVRTGHPSVESFTRARAEEREQELNKTAENLRAV